jgi:hypothetical protein
MSVMKTLMLLVALIAPLSVAAQQVGDTATIHVSASHWTTLPADRSTTSFEILTAVINGRHVELSGRLSGHVAARRLSRAVGQRETREHVRAQTDVADIAAR